MKALLPDHHQLTTNFRYKEVYWSLTANANKWDNHPPIEHLLNCQRLFSTIAQPMRNYVKTTLRGSSVYRTKQLNTRIGGSKTSSHMSGLAMDMQSHLYSPRKLARIVVHLELPFDQMIMERFPSKNQPGTWVEWLHIGIAPPGKKPRFETMVASGDRKGPNYERVSVI